MLTNGYRGLQRVAGVYRGLQVVTSGYKELEEVSGGYSGLQGVTMAVSYTHLTLPTIYSV